MPWKKSSYIRTHIHSRMRLCFSVLFWALFLRKTRAVISARLNATAALANVINWENFICILRISIAIRVFEFICIIRNYNSFLQKRTHSSLKWIFIFSTVYIYNSEIYCFSWSLSLIDHIWLQIFKCIGWKLKIWFQFFAAINRDCNWKLLMFFSQNSFVMQTFFTKKIQELLVGFWANFLIVLLVTLK